MTITITITIMNVGTGTAMTEPHDWHSTLITGDTRIDAHYRNTQNVRRFFKVEIGDRFRFDRPFMAWMKAHAGSTMRDAVDEWLRREAGR